MALYNDDFMTKEGQSKCQICGGMCEEVGEKYTKIPEGMIKDKQGLVWSWKHVTSHNDHPPFPAVEHTPKEALEKFRDWQREYGYKNSEEMFIVKLQEQNRIVIPQPIAELLKAKKGDKLRISVENVDYTAN